MLVIHIGPRKTATTYLQSNFYRNRKELLQKGWLYPVVSQRAQNAHHGVVSSKDDVLAEKGGLFKRLKRAAAQAAKANANMLISSEGFRKWKAKDFVKLGKVLDQDEVLIVYTLRDPLSLLVSVWGETIKNGRGTAFPRYAERQLADPLKSDILNALIELQPILDHPKLRLTVLNFEAVRRGSEDIYTAFGKHILGLDSLVPTRDKPANFSFPIEISDYLRHLAKITDYDPKKSEMLFSRLFLACHSTDDMEKITVAIREAGRDVRQVVRLDRDAEWYGALEADLIAKLGPRLHPLPVDGKIFPRGATEIVSHDMERLAQHPEIAKLLGESVNKLKAGRVPWTKSRFMRTWRYIQRTLGF
ncbi:hypothetical protein IHQ71_05610 [Rhizobium sp. TH2]|uniref:hypothetical protein n=1 Tax=Rhizobium sp. TH2 TaxID=2775403 RepID=UPI0021586FE0|nr:hypothetical protein [Rhizobium sp. TH2]UVC10082.1 hypothetical protein IHQ71_05610 [Rhizobium sp. TH2]